MEMRHLGNSGIRVSVLGLGTVKIGRNQGLKIAGEFPLPTSTEVSRLLATAADLGINLLDTAPAYGDSESRLGAAIIDQREKWVLTTKVGESFSDGVSKYDFRPESVQNSVERSLQRLRTDYLDVVLIHSNGDDVAILERSGALDMLKLMKSKGLIRAVGISHKTLEGAQRAIVLGCDVLMTTINRQDTEALPALSEAQQAGCGVLVKKALASGQHGPEALAFAASQPGVSSVVVGTLNPEHLTENVSAISQI